MKLTRHHYGCSDIHKSQMICHKDWMLISIPTPIFKLPLPLTDSIQVVLWLAVLYTKPDCIINYTFNRLKKVVDHFYAYVFISHENTQSACVGIKRTPSLDSKNSMLIKPVQIIIQLNDRCWCDQLLQNWLKIEMKLISSTPDDMLDKGSTGDDKLVNVVMFVMPKNFTLPCVFYFQIFLIVSY